MPMVHIYITREGTGEGRTAATAEEKARLIAGVSDLLLDTLGKPKSATFVAIHEVETDNWGWGGLPALDYRKTLEGGGGF